MSVTTETSAETKVMRRSAKRLSEVLSWELEEDREVLVRLMGQLGVRRTHVGIILAWIAEKVGRLKRNGQLTGHSPLSPLIELESLHVGINGKIDMWNALRYSVGDRVHGIDFDELVRRAERQAEELERRRLDVATNALSDRDRSVAAHIGSTPHADRLLTPHHLMSTETQG